MTDGRLCVVVVDDERTHPNADIHLRSSAEALAWMDAHPTGCAELWLDHDLGGDDTTRPVVNWLMEQAATTTPWPIGVVRVHTMNPVGAQWIETGLQRHYRVTRSRITGVATD